MNRRTKYFLILLAVSAVFLAGCSEDTTAPSGSSFMTLRTYLIQNNLDVPDVLTDWIIPASSVVGNESIYYIMDIRADSVYNVGHVPGAVNKPYDDNLDVGGEFETIEELTDGYTGILDGAKPGDVIHMCGSGVTACHNMIAMEHVGMKGSKLYPGSWSEWIRDSARPVATGDE